MLQLCKNNALDEKSIGGIFHIFSQNFSGVIREFLENAYGNNLEINKNKNANLTCKNTAQLHGYDLGALEASANESDQGATQEDANIIELDAYDLEVIEEVNEGFEKYIVSIERNNLGKLDTEEFVELINKLHIRLSALGYKGLCEEFSSLSTAITEQTKTFEQNIGLVLFLLEAVSNDLGVWKNTIINKGDTRCLEASIGSYINQMCAIIAWES